LKSGDCVFASHCDWMSQLPPKLHNIPLYDLAIPGSHDSMSYDLDINSSIIEPDRLQRLSKIYCVRKIVRKWAITQVNVYIYGSACLTAGGDYYKAAGCRGSLL
uniref:Uncharacterized protein n=1 Tax=Cyclopterus lumpus TaxID=8103 RepID=A0A8C3AVQ3_CYCLU